MGLIDAAVKRIVLTNELLAVCRERNGLTESDGCFKVIRCTRDNTVICLLSDDRARKEGKKTMHEIVTDPSVTTRFLSTEIKEEYDFLPFVLIGIEYLRMTGDMEGVHKGQIAYRKILGKCIKQEIAAMGIDGINNILP